MRITVQVTVDTPEHTEPVVREVFTLTREALGPALSTWAAAVAGMIGGLVR